MSKVNVTAKNQIQLQEWVEKLKEAGKPYKFEKNFKLLIFAADAQQILGLKGTPEVRWYHNLITLLVLFGGFALLFNWCTSFGGSGEPATTAKLIERQFSPLDGENYNLERYIKTIMYDPKSYDHIATNYIEEGDNIIVTTAIRGKNQLGALTIQKAEATLDAQGNVLEFKWLK